MPFDAPFMLGPFSVDAQGRLAPRDPGALPAFVFRWRGRLVRARLRQSVPSHGRLVLRTVLARVPSSADAAGPGPRGPSFAAVHLLRRSVPASWRLKLLPDHRLLLEARAEIELPITASGLLGELACFLLALAPYLDLLESLGMGVPADAPVAAGMVKIWPG
jgi:hypothetical protein